MEDIHYKQVTKVENFFKIVTIPGKMPTDIFKGEKNINWFDPNLFTKKPCIYYLVKVAVNLSRYSII